MKAIYVTTPHGRYLADTVQDHFDTEAWVHRCLKYLTKLNTIVVHECSLELRRDSIAPFTKTIILD